MKTELTKFQQTLSENLTDKNMTEASALLYINKLRLLNGAPFNNLNFLKDEPEINAKLIAIENHNTRRSYLTAVVNALNVSKLPKTFNKIIENYRNLLNDTIGQINSKEKSAKTQTQKENWITQDQVNEFYTKYRKRVFNLEKGEKLNSQNRTDISRFTIISLLTQIAPRRSMDFRLLLLGDADNSEKAFNYLDMEKKVMVFNKFKTSTVYGSQTVEMPKVLVEDMKYIIDLLNIKKGEYVLRNSVGKELRTSEELTSILNRLFEAKISVSMLRNIFLTNQFGEEENHELFESMAKTAKQMGNSLQSQKGYIKQKES